MNDPKDFDPIDLDEDTGLDPDESVFQAFAHALDELHDAEGAE